MVSLTPLLSLLYVKLGGNELTCVLVLELVFVSILVV